MAHKVQKIFEWFKQFNKIDIKIQGETKEFDIELGNKYLPHLLGLQYMNDSSSSIRGYALYKYIEKNNFSDKEILEKVKNNNPHMEEAVKNRIETFQEFMENIENAFIVERSIPDSKTNIKSNYFIVQSKGNDFLHLGIKQENIGSFISEFDITPKKDSWLETYFSRNNITYFQDSKIIEEIKGLYKYNEDKQEFEKFAFTGKEIKYEKENNLENVSTKIREKKKVLIPKKIKNNDRDNER
ncbi:MULTISPECIES: PBECR4 domain-containing protein [Fusobacterium]|jgi:hypothetical protein|uniref:Phage-Barnase-EndoU-ColicinE5/D-RelE like nuclease 4 domain-containing protein n=1 Tax=Fusobacterium nucleatum TaxID=851 RepID=A0A323TYE1_FUSNU|nr:MULTISPECIES: PBECR4 domain-containing protein [Fusobacterium]EUB33696.1 hypothetical protein HMPREF1501_0689 [Fusobacterium sp. OBRC1]PCR85141.1 hypothetical protein CQA79_06015 [Fusobacterium nucleatum]PZA05123.1 hypothetical protein DNF10_02290 [Fusobacterium nucleatum]QJX51675.1 hypothetical protein HOO60_12325 [Fusobacterium nucleatum]HCE32592.1 hypothetical protein [Fusobacterium sp.]